MSERQREIKEWESGQHKEWDLKEESRLANQTLLNGFGRDRLTYTPETYQVQNEYWRYNESGISHGYPATAWLQIGLCYAAGVYTAKEQCIIGKTGFFKNFWAHHYFDWIMFGRRAFTYGIVGGLVAGTIMFGRPDLALRRANGRYEQYFSGRIPDVRNNTDMWHVKFNN